jgi:D-hexose-6-phosphate mutarotase
MREAQEREAMLSGEEDDEFLAMVCVEARRAERKVDEYLEAIKDVEFKIEQ